MKSVSASSINMYETCPLQWYFNYKLKLIQLPNPAFLIGTAYHKAIELFHRGRNQDQIKNEIKKLLLSKDKTKEEIERYALVNLMFRKYKEYPLKGNIINNEFKFRQDVPNLPVPLYGFIDRVDTDKIGEYKTSSFDYKIKDIETLQSKIYTYVVWKQKGKLLPVYYHIMNKKKAKKKDYKPQIMMIQYEEEDMLKLEKTLIEFYNKVINEKQFPYKQGVHCRWCAFGNTSGTGNCRYSL